MRVIRRPLAPSEVDHELVWLSVTLVVLALASGWFTIGLPWPRCVFHTLTGFPCLTCGATRCALQFFHGHFLAALQWNPIVFMSLLTLSVFDIYAFGVLIFRAPRIRIMQMSAGERNFARITVIGLFAINWLYLLAHWRNF